ncbi:hypothetical protein HWV62_16696 [Athelia sp. TMB]|nr:hypothetical protein HWV62_16696 [Athelia sp. TMB]
MPRRKQKSARAKLQRTAGNQFKAVPEEQDSASAYTSDSEREDSSEEEFKTAVRKLFARRAAQRSVNKVSNVYTGDSRTTKYRKAAEWRQAAKGCGNVADMFVQGRKPVPDLQLMAEDDVYHAGSEDLPHVSDVQLELDFEFDFHDLCIDQVNGGFAADDEIDDWDNDKIWPGATDVPNGTIEEDVEDWFDLDDMYEVPQSLKDILEIIKICLQNFRKMKSGRTVKMLTQLTAVAEYVKLRECYTL